MANGNDITTEIKADNIAPTTQDPISGAGSVATPSPQIPETTTPIEGLPDQPQPQFDLGIEQPVTQAPQEQIDRLTEEVKVEEPTPTEEPRITTQPSGETIPKEQVTQAVEEVKPVETATTTEKIKTAEEIKAESESIKSQELANKAIEEEQITQEQEKASNDFTKAIRSGNLDEARNLVLQNPELRGVFNSSAKVFLRDKGNVEFFSKYANASNDELDSAKNSGDLVIGSDKYNLLPDETKKRFEAFSKQQSSSGKTDFTNDNEKVISLADTIAQVQTLFTSNIRENLDAKMNSKPMQTSRDRMKGLQDEISDIDESLDAIEDDVRDTFSKLPLSMQNAEIAKRKKDLTREKNSLVNDYNTELGFYKTMKDDIEIEFEVSKLEDANNKDVFNTALSIYETRRGEMREDEKLKFLEESKKLASARQLANQKELAQFNADLNSKKLGGGKYFDDGEGNMVYVKDGKQVNVLSGLGENVGGAEDEEYSYKTYKNDDGTYTTFGYPKKGQNILQMNYNADGTISDNYVSNTGTGSITSYGGEHDKFRGLDVDGNVGDPVTSPLAGTVVEAMSHPQFGETMVVKLDDGNKIRFSHLDTGFYSVGDSIAEGTVIGTLGNTGNVLNLDGTKPTKAQLAEGFGSHLDIVTTDDQGRVRSAKETETYLNNLSEVDRPDKPLTKSQTVFFNQQLSKFRSDPSVKAFESALSSGGDLIQSLGSVSGPGDVAAIFQFMKTLDPASVVRESEFAVAANTAGISSKPELIFKKISTGELLTDGQRKEFGRLAFEFVRNKGKLYDIKYGDMERALSTSGIGGDVLPTKVTNLITDFDQVRVDGTTTTPGGYTINYNEAMISTDTNKSSYSGFWDE